MLIDLFGLDIKGPGKLKVSAQSDADAAPAVVVFTIGEEEHEVQANVPANAIEEIECSHDKTGVTRVKAQVKDNPDAVSGPYLLDL